MTENQATEPTPDPDHNQALPYVEMTDKTYADLTAQNFTIEEPEPGAIILRGPCPRCNALIDIPVVDSIFRSTRNVRFWRHRAQNSEPKTNVEPMMCTCEEEHPNRPEGLYGCGAYWTLTISALAQ